MAPLAPGGARRLTQRDRDSSPRRPGHDHPLRARGRITDPGGPCHSRAPPEAGGKPGDLLSALRAGLASHFTNGPDAPRFDRAPRTCTALLLVPSQAGRCLPMSPWSARRESNPSPCGHLPHTPLIRRRWAPALAPVIFSDRQRLSDCLFFGGGADSCNPEAVQAFQEGAVSDFPVILFGVPAV